MRLSRLELAVVIVGFLGIGIFLAIVAGGPLGSDELWYMQAGLNNVKDPFIVNRYFHVYLQKLFMELAPNPLAGVRAFWGFLIALTGFMVYFNARVLSDRNNIIHGVIAVAFFFSYSFISEASGAPFVDFTAMTMVMLVITLYIYAVNHPLGQKWLLVALGFVFFLAFKSKETALSSGVVLLGLGFVDGTVFNISKLWRNIRPVLIGLLAGIAFFIVLDTILLQDPLFSLKPATLRALVNTYESFIKYHPAPDNWYSSYLMKFLPLPFLLYIVSGIYSEERFSVSLRLVWLVPLVLIVFLTLTMIRSSWGIIPRYIFPVLPVISFLAPQFQNFELPAARSSRIKLGLCLLAGVLILGVLRFVFLGFTGSVSWNLGDFLGTIFYPIILSVLLGTVFLGGRHSTRTVLILLLCVEAMTVYPILTNIKGLVITRPAAVRVQERFYPFSSFTDQIKYTSSMKMYVSLLVPQEMQMLSADKNELLSMFNVYFDSSAVRTNFTYSKSPDTIPDDLRKTDYDYVLLTTKDWQVITSDVANASMIEAKYQVFYDPRQSLVFLKHN
jgi:hypothetical protein